MKNLGEKRDRLIVVNDKYGNEQKFNKTKLIKLFVLHYLINNGPSIGLEIVTKINTTLHINVSRGLVYPLLRNMEENLFLRGWWEDMDRKNKRFYAITDEGIEHYNTIKNIYLDLIISNRDIYNRILKEIYNK